MNKNDIHNIASNINSGKILIVLGAIIGLLAIYKLAFASVMALSFAIIPLVIVAFLLIVKYYHRIFYLLFISHFILLIVSSFTEIKLGILTLSFNMAVTLLIIIISVYKKISWKESKNAMLGLYGIWAIYCIAELANPNTVLAAWGVSITHYVVYPVVCAILVPMTIRRYKNVEWLLILWSIFILLAAFKGFYQKHYGFTQKELEFLFLKGGAETHIIWSGVRYFSFFTDAANFGVHMAMAIVCFGISFFYVTKKWIKAYFLIVVIAAVYGMFISGTRSAMAVPLGGLLALVFIAKNKKTFFFSLIGIVAIVFFFRGTTIGDNNQYIRKMRSAFMPKDDASYMVRVTNRELMKTYMADKPFGYGLGLGGKAERFSPKEYMPIPPDSWLVNVWTDTGIVGLILYIIIHIILFAWCSWILMFKMYNKKLRYLLTAWLCMNAGFFVAAYANDVMQYPNTILLYTGFAICFAGPRIEKGEGEEETELKDKQLKTDSSK